MMRVFELSTRVQSIGRGTGSDASRKPRSATAAAAYRACCVIACEREGVTHDYTRKQGLEACAIVLPDGAPAWAADRAALWNAAELRERNGKRGKNAGLFKKDAKTAREFMFAFPAELSAEGRFAAAHRVARHMADTHGVAADFVIHRPGRNGDERNYHCHMMITTRRMTPAGLTVKTREWDDLKSGAALGKAWRAFVAQTLNDGLAAEGKDNAVFVEHRSLKARGGGRLPTRHQGVRRTNRQRRQTQQDRQTWARSARAEQHDSHAREVAALNGRQGDALLHKLDDLAARERQGIEDIRDALARADAADRPPEGLNRLFQTATGAARRGDLERQARAAQRRAAAAQQIAALKESLRAERAAYMREQINERARLAERHRQEDRQLARAVTARVAFDRAAETESRRRDSQEPVRQHIRKDREFGLN